MARSDELLTAAADAVATIVAEHGERGTVSDETLRLMRLAWFAGYGAGLDTSSAIANRAFDEMKAALA